MRKSILGLFSRGQRSLYWASIISLVRKRPIEKLLTVLTVAAILWYLLLCTLHYFSGRPLWNDEHWVFVSIRDFSPLELFQRTLVKFQVFPRLYMFFIQRISQPFDFHVLSLRLPSFVCMLTGFFLWLKWAKYEFKEKLDYFTFVACWCGSVPLVYYSAELKPYSMDVLCCAIFMLFLYNQERLENSGERLKYTLTLVGLPLLCLFSYPAFILSTLPGYNLLLSTIKDKRKASLLIIYGLSFLAVVALAYFIDMRHRPLRVLNYGFADYFISFASVGEFFKTFGEGTMNLFSRWFIERPRLLKKIGIFFAVWGMIWMYVGFFSNIKRDHYRLKSLHTIAFVIYVELFILGALKKYPFTVPRTVLFYSPIFFFLVIKGVTSLKYLNVLLSRLIHGAFLYYVIFVSIGLSFFVFVKQLSFAPALW